MCLAIPGKIISMKDDSVIVQYPGERRTAKNVGLKIKKGDYVLVQAKIVVQKIPEDEAIESLKAWKSVKI
jgi:hydrogenase assembly chaperone HypC/HupF